MKFTVERNALAGALDRVCPVVITRPTIPVLADLRMKAEGETITIETTDLGRWAKASAPAKIETPGEQLADALMLRQYTKALPSGAEIAIEGGDRMKVRTGKSSARIPGGEVPDFPAFKNDDTALEFVCPGFIDALKFLAPAMSNEVTREYLNGIFVKAGDNKLELCATDGHLLARQDIDIPLGATGLPATIIPRQAIPNLIAMGDDVMLRIGKRRITAESGSHWFASKLIGLSYPDYTRVVPASHELTFRVERDALLDAMARLAAVATQTPAFRLIARSGELQIESDMEPLAGGEEIVTAEYDGPEAMFGFAHRVLSAAIKWCGETVEIGADNAPGPVTIRDPEQPERFFVAMQWRVSSVRREAA